MEALLLEIVVSYNIIRIIYVYTQSLPDDPKTEHKQRVETQTRRTK